MSDRDHSHNLLYLRRDGRIRGPFAAGAVKDFLRKRRIRPSDEVSLDRENWRPANRLQELLEQGATDPMEHHRLEAGLQRGTHVQADTPQPEPVPWPLIVSLGIGFVTILLFGLWYGKPAMDPPPQCEQAAAPGVIWRSCRLNGLNAEGADLRHADLRGALLRRADLATADLSGSDASYVILEGAQLSFANLRGANLKGASLAAADLTNADLRGAELAHADLRGARLGGALLAGAHFRSTLWVDGHRCTGAGPSACRTLPLPGIRRRTPSRNDRP